MNSHLMQSYYQGTVRVKKFASLAPKNLKTRLSFTIGGGTAIEAAMKIALKNKRGA